MKRWGIGQLVLVLVCSAAAYGVVAVACAGVGSTGVGVPTQAQWILRREPVVIASIVGASLALAGVVYQAVLRNPLAEPYLLGVSGGASLGMYLWVLPASAVPAWVAATSQQSLSFAGAIGALLLVFALAQRRGRIDPVTLLLVGVIVNSISGALYVFLDHLNLTREGAGGGGALRMLVGGIRTYLSAGQIATAGIVLAVGFVATMWLAPRLNVSVLSEEEAQSLGVRIHRLRWVALLVASLVTAAAVSVSGPIGFVGLLCPHLARLLVGSDHRRLVPVSAAAGASLLAIADAASRGLSPWTSGPLPVGVLTGLLGGPFFLYLLWRSRRGEAG